MATLKHSPDDHHVRDVTATAELASEDTIDVRRARRMAALKKVAGIWADRSDIPADGLIYQHDMRSEWRG